MQPEGAGWRIYPQGARKCRECLARKHDGSVRWVAASIGSQPGARPGRRPSRGMQALGSTRLRIGKRRWEIATTESAKKVMQSKMAFGVTGFQGLQLRRDAIFCPLNAIQGGLRLKCRRQSYLRSDAISGVRFVIERVIRGASLVLVKPTSMPWMRSSGAIRRSSTVSHPVELGRRGAAESS